MINLRQDNLRAASASFERRMAGLLAHGSRSRKRPSVALAFPALSRILRGGRFVEKEASGPGCSRHACQWLFTPSEARTIASFPIGATGRPHRSTVAGSAAIGNPLETAFVAFPLRLRLPGETIQVTEKGLGAMDAHVNRGGSPARTCPARPQALRRPDRAPDQPSGDRSAPPPQPRNSPAVRGDRHPSRRARADRSP